MVKFRSHEDGSELSIWEDCITVQLTQSTKLLLFRKEFLLKNDCIIRSTLFFKTLIIGSREYLRIKSKEHKN